MLRQKKEDGRKKYGRQHTKKICFTVCHLPSAIYRLRGGIVNLLLIPIFIPLAAGIICLAVNENLKRFREIIAVAASLFSAVACIYMLGAPGQEMQYSPAGWAGFGFDFNLRLYGMNSFFLASINVFGALICLYSTAFIKSNARFFYFYLLLTVSFASGAVLANNLVLLVFFWEGLLITQYTFIALGETKNSKATAMKAFIILGVCDLCLLLGAAITGTKAGTMCMTSIKLSMDSAGTTAYILMMIGAIAKGGSMPFHTWIPDAAVDAPLPFMAFIPAALEKLLGIYLLYRISVDLFIMSPAVKLLVMTIGAATLLFAVMMALIQKDYKRLLSYHAISQVGYMILGIGTGTPAGVIGALFHMINNAIYKSCLFLTAGSVEKAAGTSDLTKLGGLLKKMPVTALCFLITAASISGIPPFNGFFSKELVFDGAYHSGYPIFFWIAEIGAIFTLMSFLKLGHSVYFGKRPAELANVKESSWQMLVPMIILTALCLIFGFGAYLPIQLIFAPYLRESGIFSAEPLWGWHLGFIFMVSIGALIIGLINHIYGSKKTKKAVKAADHIHYAPVLKQIYGMAERRVFDTYDQGMKFINLLGRVLFGIDRAMDFITDTLPAGITALCSNILRKVHNGMYPNYMAWALIGLLIFAVISTR